MTDANVYIPPAKPETIHLSFQLGNPGCPQGHVSLRCDLRVTRMGEEVTLSGRCGYGDGKSLHEAALDWLAGMLGTRGA